MENVSLIIFKVKATKINIRREYVSVRQSSLLVHQQVTNEFLYLKI